ncbi:sigma-70 family RNA polymerase sigma factor [Variovorax sp. UC122_21]|uniref:sigma-70 family RNA polymerase sigma factor n=1 Tax=Variovorax sp. UC122_21 TaxID=3374554 RepID=UPI00375709FC
MLDERYLSQFPLLRGRLVRAAARLVGGTAQAEDLVQDSYLRALEAGEHAGIDSTQAWLTTVMQHLAIDRLRREGWMRRWLDEAGSTPETAESAESEAARAEETGQALRLLAERLSPADGAAVLLREVFEVSFKELAEVTGRTEAAWRQQMHRALLRLREPREKASDAAGRDAAFALYQQALRDADARLLFAMLRQPPARAIGLSVHAAPPPASGSPRAACQVVQIGGRLGLVLTLGGKLLCVLPLEARQEEQEKVEALSL